MSTRLCCLHSGSFYFLSWHLKENAKGTLVQLVWKSRHDSEAVGSNKKLKKSKKPSPSRQRRSRDRLLGFISNMQYKDVPVSSGKDTGSESSRQCHPLKAQEKLDVVTGCESAHQCHPRASAALESSNPVSLPALVNQAQHGIQSAEPASEPIKLGTISRLPDESGHFIR